MGWSCRAHASATMRAWSDACIAQTGSQNVYESRGSKYFWEASNTEHTDGAITGSIWKFLGESKCKKVGGFRIEGHGEPTKAPAFLKAAAKNAKPVLPVGIGSSGDGYGYDGRPMLEIV